MSLSPPNAFLRALAPEVLDQLSHEFVGVHLERGAEIAFAGETVAFVYFPLDSLISATRSALDGFTVETGLIGCEGAASVAQVMGSGLYGSRLQAQIGGLAIRVPAQTFRRVAQDDAACGKTLWQAIELQMWDAEQSSLCLAAHPVEARLARWLLEAEDRSARHGREMGITHEFLAIMLGVQRTTVTRALGQFSERGLIVNGRGVVRVNDKAGLKAIACECHAEAQAERLRLGLEACPA